MKYLISVAVRRRARAFAALLICTTFASRAFGSAHEMGFTYRYETAKSPVNYFSNHELQLTYLRPFSFLWAGFDLKYGNNHSANNIHSSIFEIGGLAKYWIVDPGPSVGFNIFSGLAIGKENTGTDPVTTTTIIIGPELAWFISEGVAISTRIQYSTRRAGPTYTGLGLYSGLSLFF